MAAFADVNPYRSVPVDFEAWKLLRIEGSGVIMLTYRLNVELGDKVCLVNFWDYKLKGKFRRFNVEIVDMWEEENVTVKGHRGFYYRVESIIDQWLLFNAF